MENHEFFFFQNGVTCVKSTGFTGSSESRSIFVKKKLVLKKNDVTCMKKYWFLQVFSKSRSFFGKL